MKKSIWNWLACVALALGLSLGAAPWQGAYADDDDDDDGGPGLSITEVLVVFEDVEAAARCALDMQAAVDAVDPEALGLPDSLGLRLAGHIGPVFAGEDPVRKEPAYYGSHMTRAARMEPVTPRGQVYVSGPFAAGLALSRAPGLTCEYVGHLPTAKEFGSMRMHVLVDRDG